MGTWEVASARENAFSDIPHVTGPWLGSENCVSPGAGVDDSGGTATGAGEVPPLAAQLVRARSALRASATSQRCRTTGDRTREATSGTGIIRLSQKSDANRT